MSDSCEHDEIVESRRWPDESVDGRCVQCGLDGFPIRDVAYEEFRSADGAEAVLADAMLAVSGDGNS
jgi:hypothetical protein